jgi:hypothetical protein
MAPCACSANGVYDPRVNSSVENRFVPDDFHESEVEYALTEPRHIGRLERDMITDEEWERFKGVSEHEIHAFIYRWENTPLDDYIKNIKDLQIESLRLIIHGEIADIHYDETIRMDANDPVISALHKRFPPVGPGSPLISNIEIRSIDPETAVAVYHRSEYELNGNSSESESALIMVRSEGKWKAAAFTRRPLPSI